MIYMSFLAKRGDGMSFSRDYSGNASGEKTLYTTATGAKRRKIPISVVIDNPMLLYFFMKYMDSYQDFYVKGYTTDTSCRNIKCTMIGDAHVINGLGELDPSTSHYKSSRLAHSSMTDFRNVFEILFTEELVKRYSRESLGNTIGDYWELFKKTQKNKETLTEDELLVYSNHEYYFVCKGDMEMFKKGLLALSQKNADSGEKLAD